jgi:hypothetical protein
LNTRNSFVKGGLLSLSASGMLGSILETLFEKNPLTGPGSWLKL